MHWRRKWQPTPVFLPGESQGTGEPGGLPSTGSHRVGHNRRDLAAAASFDSDTLNITIFWGNAAAQSQIHTVFVIHCYVLFSQYLIHTSQFIHMHIVILYNCTWQPEDKNK